MNSHRFGVKYFLLAIGILFPYLLSAQIANLRFEKLDIPDVPTFPNQDCFYEDSKGFLWSGAYSGLNMVIFQHKTFL